MALAAAFGTQITLKNGDEVKVNDHVYCSPSWSIRDGTPYSVARIMEFLPAQGVPTFDETGKRNGPLTRVRLAWYYRPSDVSDRTVADSRLLLAAIYSEVCEISQLRAKCYVIHRDKISDLAGWKKRPDRFYFQRLFDPWIRKEFEVIQASSVRNIPEEIREVLVSRYEYVVAEKEVVPDLTDNLRTCATCEKWCPPQETVQCDRCKKFFHMACVNPPLLAKPSRGYGWTCAPCSREHEEEVDSHQVARHLTPVNSKPKSNAPPPRGRGRPRKDRMQAEKEENMEIKHFKMWPFRYFGQYTVAEDTLDPDDLIFPRAATRVGPKYQVSAFPTASTDVEGPAVPGEDERGGENTIEVLSKVCDMASSEVQTLETLKHGLTRSEKFRYNVDWLTEVIRRFSDAWLSGHSFTNVSMKSPMRLEKWKKTETPYTDRGWSDAEIAAFEDALMVHGAELRPVREEVGTRAMNEVVRFYGHWKNAKLGEQNARIRAARAVGKPDPDLAAAADSDDEGSVVTELTRTDNSCGACRTRESDTWWKAPKALALATNVLCDNCGISWRKYADLNVRPYREEVIVKPKPSDKREGTPLAAPNSKRQRTSVSTTTPPPVVAPQLRCLACHKNGPSSKILRCRQCQLRVHPGACGVVVDAATFDNWTCELCQNDKSLEASLKHDCLLCPRTKRDPKKKSLYPPPDSYLRACKPTEGQGWVHVLCSVFVPEVTYTDATRLRRVEAISTIPSYRWMNKCTLCDSSGGAVVRCSDCPAEYHVSCAWKAGHKFGFEVQPVQTNRKDSTTVVDFNSASGVMVPLVTCKGHPQHRRQTFGICETNEGGETAMQAYCKNYKQTELGNTHGLLRKAHRLDEILNTEDSIDSESSQSSPDPVCSRCHTEFSPLFYPTPPSTPPGDSTPSSTSQTWLCHRCHFTDQQRNGSIVNNHRGHFGLNGIVGVNNVVNGVNGIVSV
ncbi:hypothetical protein BDY19DRAFT_991192 [Irpex rosettiformis]|uniref:Uncharacterized protein n=1 Tax=Irpex rosettiformis TaxID=378272 RepID=A0ACB8UB67_9APHY|nr:hypothetical protein BDY19DRAFT_991192 [Irpex rosettiformis]